METCRGIILNTVPFSDTQKIIHLYAKEKGYLSMLSPSSVFKRKNAPLHLLQITEVEYLENPKGGLHKLKSAAPLVQLPALYFDVVKMNIILLWGEILSRLLRNEGPNEPLFDFITRSVEYLNASEGDTANFNLYFLYRLTAPLGYRINTDTWQPGALFNPHDGCFHLPGTTANTISGPNTARIIHRLCTCQTADLAAIPLNRDARNILLDTVLAYYRIHLGANFNLKSLNILREIFS